MDFKDHISEIQKSIRSGLYTNEAAISRGIVMRIFQALNWPIFDTSIVRPEFPLGTLFVDYALCHPRNKPAIIVEVKDIGKLEGADTKLFEYAFNAGTTMAILTDGQEWHFYLPAARGSIQERRFYKLDLLETDIEKIDTQFKRYLSYENVCTGKSEKEARVDYDSQSIQRDIETNLPIAWRKILEEQDSILIDLISEKVADLCGYYPEPDVVSVFIRKQIQTPFVTPLSEVQIPVSHMRNDSLSQMGYVLKGKRYIAKNGREVLIEVMKLLAKSDPNFLSRFDARKHGIRRRYIAQAQNDLYPGRPDLSHLSEEIYPGWWVGTNYGKRNIKTILELACEVAGITFGTDLVIDLGEKAKLPELKDYPPSNTVPGGQKKEPILPFKSTFYIKAVRGANAKAEINQEGVVIKQGSEIATSVTATVPDHAEKQRQELIDREIVVPKGDKLVFSQDFLFTNPSIAAAIVMGRSAGGPLEWKDERGRTLKSYQEKDI